MHNWQDDDDNLPAHMRRLPAQRENLPMVPSTAELMKMLESGNRNQAIQSVARSEAAAISQWLATRNKGEQHMEVGFHAESRSRRFMGRGERLDVSMRVDIW